MGQNQLAVYIHVAPIHEPNRIITVISLEQDYGLITGVSRLYPLILRAILLATV
jgi:hypothetical protein